MSKLPAMWRRVGTPQSGFSYVRADGSPLRSQAGLARIARLRIPPAWADVEISPRSGDKVQATGVDAAGRKQYLYHSEFVVRGQRRKFGKLMAFAHTLPQLREVTDQHLKGEGLGRERVLATIVRLMVRGFFRVGSERYAVANKTFGITTLQKRHLRIQGSDLHFRYVGKKSIDQRQVVAETPLVAILQELLEAPGRRLFRYQDGNGGWKNVTAADVNGYLRDILGERYTSKDIRTWGGTVRAATILADLGPARSESEAKKNLVLACKLVSAELGNTPAVCRSAYIHPAVLDRYLTGETIAPKMRQEPRPAKSPTQFYAEEAALMRFLEKLS
ncbi:MAG: DNA topoisomerase IB [Gemmatimonadota bacterium]|nr:DNA topoisomerase IB [Gemmatimonadota bacterium]